ncbi:trans-sialidase, putative, partial [Trypanosoma cruzi marinkellei]
MIIYSTDNGSAWALSEDMSPAKCLNTRVTEWEGSLLMIVDCEDGQRVYESRDMGTTWTEAIETLSGVWGDARSGVSLKESLRVDALITATSEKRRSCCTLEKSTPRGRKGPLRSIFGTRTTTARFLLDRLPWTKLRIGCSPALYCTRMTICNFLQRRGNCEGCAMSVSRLTEELSTIESVPSTWAQKAFSSPTIYTHGVSGGSFA